MGYKDYPQTVFYLICNNIKLRFPTVSNDFSKNPQEKIKEKEINGG